MRVVKGLIAAALTVVAGIGTAHALFDRPRRALFWLGAVAVAFVATTLTFWGFALYIAILGGAIVDAFLCGWRRPRGTRLRYVLALGILVVNVSFALCVRAFVLEAFRNPSTSMYPTIELGDEVLVNKLASTRVGDLVVFQYPCDPSRDYMKRIIAKGGDTVEVRCDVVYVNGKALASKLVAERRQYSDFDSSFDESFLREASIYREQQGGHSYEVAYDAERPARDRRERVSGSDRDFPMRSYPASPSCAETMEAVSLAPGAESGGLVETKQEALAAACEPQLHYVVPADHFFVLGDNRYNSNDSRVWGGVPVSMVKGRVSGIYSTKRADGRSFGRVGPVE